MAPITRARAGKWHASRRARRRQARHQITGQKWTVARHAHDVGDRGPTHGRPVEPGENPGKRPGKARNRIRYDRKTGIGEARGIAIGVEDDCRALRLEAGEHALEDALAGYANTRLVAAAHAPRQSAGEHQAQRRCFGGCPRHGRVANVFRIGWRSRLGYAAAQTSLRSLRKLDCAPGMTTDDVVRMTSIIVHRGLAPVLGTLLLDVVEVLIEHDALLACERDEPLAARAADQREIGLAR